MSTEQFQRAKDLIQNRQFDEARAILYSINHPRAAEWLLKLDEIAPPPPTAPRQNTIATFECTQCFRAVGPEMRQCDYRDHGQCAFEYVQQPAGKAALGLVSIFAGVFLVLPGMCLISVGEGNVFYIAISAMVCLGLAVAAILFGLFKFAGVQTRIIDINTAILWHKEEILGFPVRSEMVERSEILDLPVDPNFMLKYPPSVSGLIADGDLRRQAVRSIVNALLILAAKGQIDLVQVDRQTGNVFGQDHPKKAHLIKVYTKPRGNVVMGSLETRMMVTLQQWYDKPKPLISAEGMFLVDLGYNLFVEKVIRDPFGATLAVVRRDAYQSGSTILEDQSGGSNAPRRSPEINPELGEQVRIIQQICDKIEEKYPELVSKMEKEVRKGLQKRADERRQSEVSRDDILRILIRSAVRAISRM